MGLGLSSLFVLAARSGDRSGAPGIAAVLRARARWSDRHVDRALDEGVAALEALDRALLVATCQKVLDETRAAKKTEDDTRSEKLRARFLYALIRVGQRADYARYISKPSIESLLRYGRKRVAASSPNGIWRERALQREDLPLDWASFGLPAN